MDPIKGINKDYLATLKERVKKSRVYTPFQSTALLLTEILNDKEHKALYMRVTKMYDNQQLIGLAKDLAERKNVDNRGAYFMRMLKTLERIDLVEKPEYVPGNPRTQRAEQSSYDGKKVKKIF